MPTKKVAKKSVTKKIVKKSVVKKVVKKPSVKKAVKKVARKPVAKKSVTKKVVARKSAAKKTTKKSPAKRVTKKDLILANDETSFWTTNGQILNSLAALRDALDEMEKEVYMYHAGGQHNDFANWVDAVLSDSKCAKDLEKAKTTTSAKTIIVRHLKAYSV